MVSHRLVHAVERAAAQLADDTAARHAPDLPLFRLVLVLVHVAHAVEAKAEGDEEDGLDEQANEDVAISNDNVYTRLTDERATLAVFDALGRAFLRHDCGAPDAQDEQNEDVDGHRDDVQNDAVPETHEATEKDLTDHYHQVLADHEDEVLGQEQADVEQAVIVQ